jgi:hypothetical protein
MLVMMQEPSACLASIPVNDSGSESFQITTLCFQGINGQRNVRRKFHINRFDVHDTLQRTNKRQICPTSDLGWLSQHEENDDN